MAHITVTVVAVYSVGLDKWVMMYIHHCSIIQITFTVLERESVSTQSVSLFATQEL